LKPYYIRDINQTPYSIDEYVLWTGNFFKPAYVIAAKSSGYDYARYYLYFFMADMIFPLIYTCMFLSIISGIKKNAVYVLFLITILGACIFDYLEDFSFAVFISTRGDELAPAVAFFTTIKSFLYLANVMICAGCLLYYWKYDKAVKISG
jgi:hypothetical protein